MAAVTPLLPGACLDECPPLVRETLRVIGTKWAVPILVALLAAPGPLRYAELRRRVGTITSKELARHLRNLESSGLIERTVYPTVPPQVDYRVTGEGEATVPLLHALAGWGARLRGPGDPTLPPCADTMSCGGRDRPSTRRSV
ncbi:MAG: winged helix-turn-helix transcriptional regulator [Longimicrobiales bacterium]